MPLTPISARPLDAAMPGPDLPAQGTAVADAACHSLRTCAVEEDVHAAVSAGAAHASHHASDQASDQASRSASTPCDDAPSVSRQDVRDNIIRLCRVAQRKHPAAAAAGEALFLLWRDGPRQICMAAGDIALDMFRRKHGLQAFAEGLSRQSGAATRALSSDQANTSVVPLAAIDPGPPGHFLYIVRAAAQSVNDVDVMQAIDRTFLAAPGQQLRAIVDDNTRVDRASGARHLGNFWERARFVQAEEINAFGKQQNQQHVRIMTCINIGLAHEKEQIAQLAAADDRPMLVPILSGWHWRLVVLYERGARGVLYDSMREPDRSRGFDRPRVIDGQVAQWFAAARFVRHVHDQMQGQGQVPNGCGLFVCDMMEKIVQGFPSRQRRLPIYCVMSTGIEEQKSAIAAAPDEFNRRMRLRLIEPFLDPREADANDGAGASDSAPQGMQEGLAQLRGALVRASRLGRPGKRPA